MTRSLRRALYRVASKTVSLQCGHPSSIQQNLATDRMSHPVKISDFSVAQKLLRYPEAALDFIRPF